MCRFLVAVLALPLLGAPAAAQQALGELFHQTWELREGAPGTITAITQAPEGYLWVVSPSGLFRFDGVQFERMRLPDAPIRRPVAAWTFADGSLWVVHDRGALTRVVDGRRTTFTDRDGLPVVRGVELARDHDGVMWAAGDGGVARLVGNRWETVVEARTSLAPTVSAYGLLVDRAGAIWTCVDGQVLVRRRRDTPFEPFMPLAVMQFVQAPDGAVVAVARPPEPVRAIGTAGGGQLDASAAGGFTVPGRRAAFDASGNLWLATSDGVTRLRWPTLSAGGHAELERMTQAGGLTHDSALVVSGDREGNVWIGTAGGLDLFRETAVVNADPLPPMHAARLAGRGADVWAGGRTTALVRVRDGTLHATGLPAPVAAINAAADGTVWVWSGERLWRGTATTGFTAVLGMPGGEPDEAWSLAVDGRGRVWAQFLRSGGWILENGGWRRPSVTGLEASAIAIVLDDGQGRVWLSDPDGAVVVRVDGDAVRHYGTPHGLDIGQLTGLVTDGPRTWLAGRLGIAAIDADRVRPIAGLDEDSVGTIRGIARDPEGALWLNADSGIVRLAADEAARAAGQPSAIPAFRVFDYLDGMVGGSAPRPPQSAFAAPNGELWFVGYDRVFAVDPARLAAASAPPPVRVTTLRTGDRDYTAADGLTLPVGSTNVRVAYTGLSLTMPDRVRFRYQLDGVDDGWQEAGGRREAFYTNLAPGTYTFRVIASNNNGVWPETGTATTFVVPPAVHQTLAFRIGVVLALIAAVWAAIRLRVRQVTAAHHGRLEARVAERERIARELHDTLLQGVQGLILRFQAIASRLPAGDPAATAMEDALSRADDVLAEGRLRVRDLRQSTVASPDLADALAQTGKELAAEGDLGFSLAVEGAPRPLHPIVSDEVFWIVREAITNAVRHGAARRIEAEVAYAGDALRLRCRDDGEGMPAAVLADGRAEHFGLRGMKERATRIGARVEVWSRAGAGTEVEVRVPAVVAYADQASPWWARLRHAWSGGSAR